MFPSGMYQQPVDPRELTYQSKCPVCGGESFEWGRLGGQTYYVPGQNMWRMRNYQYVRIRRCLTCNNLLAFTDPEMSARYRRMTYTVVVLVLIGVLFAVLFPILMSVGMRTR
jgi:hypothetical protein